MPMQTYDPNTPIQLTDKAHARISALIAEEPDAGLKFRIFVTGGGCSGFQYGFSFDSEVAEDDFQANMQGVVVLVDALSYPYLEGSEVDFSEGLEGAKFVINNPNAVTTCGCGSSFAV